LKGEQMKRLSWVRRAVRACILKPMPAAITPAQVWQARLVAGILAAAAVAVGPRGFALGGALFVIATLLGHAADDLCDAQPSGDVRVRSRQSWDIAVSALIFIGLGIGLRHTEHGLAAPAMGCVAALSVIAVPWLIKRLEAIDGRPSDEFGGVYGLDPEDILLLVPLALWAGWAEALLVVAAFGAAAFASAFYMTHYRKFTSA
jgi:hypothetical protein